MSFADGTQAPPSRGSFAADLARLTGLDPAQLNETINLALPQAGLTLDGLEFINGEAVLRGTTQ